MVFERELVEQLQTLVYLMMQVVVGVDRVVSSSLEKVLS